RVRGASEGWSSRRGEQPRHRRPVRRDVRAHPDLLQGRKAGRPDRRLGVPPGPRADDSEGHRLKSVRPALPWLAALLISCAPAAAGGVEEGDKLPAGWTVPVVDLKGQEVDLRAALGKQGATLLVFWGTWCQPCLHEVPEIREVARFYAPKGLRV